MSFEKTVASLRWGIEAAKQDRSTFYGFYTGEHATELFGDFLNKMPEFMFDGDRTAAYAYRSRIVRYAERMDSILEDSPA